MWIKREYKLALKFFMGSNARRFAVPLAMRGLSKEVLRLSKDGVGIANGYS